MWIFRGVWFFEEKICPTVHPSPPAHLLVAAMAVRSITSEAPCAQTMRSGLVSKALAKAWRLELQELGVSEDGGKNPPKSSICSYGFALKTIHFGVFPYFLETPSWKLELLFFFEGSWNITDPNNALNNGEIPHNYVYNYHIFDPSKMGNLVTPVLGRDFTGLSKSFKLVIWAFGAYLADFTWDHWWFLGSYTWK